MSPSPEEFCNRLKANFPESSPKLTSFPSEAFMIDVVIGQEMHVIEYLPTLGFGVSRLSTGTFGWEGVENQFDTMEAVAAYVVGLLKKAEPDQIDPKCEQAQ